MNPIANPLFKAKEPRYKILRISLELLMDMRFSPRLRMRADGTAELMAVSLKGIPEDAQVEAISNDLFFESNGLALRVWSSEFPIVEFSHSVPPLDVELTAYSYEVPLTPDELRAIVGLPSLVKPGILAPPRRGHYHELWQEIARLESLLAAHHDISFVRRAFEQGTGDCELCRPSGDLEGLRNVDMGPEDSPVVCDINETTLVAPSSQCPHGGDHDWAVLVRCKPLHDGLVCNKCCCVMDESRFTLTQDRAAPPADPFYTKNKER